MTTILIIVSIALLLSYTIGVCIKDKGIPYSISATYYSLKHKFWFGVSMMGGGMSLMPAILEMSKSNTEWAAFLACFGVVLVGFSPNFRDSFVYTVHMTGAVLCVLFSQVWVAMNSPIYLLVWVIYLIYTIICMINSNGIIINRYLSTKPMFWVEIAALTSTYLALT